MKTYLKLVIILLIAIPCLIMAQNDQEPVITDSLKYESNYHMFEYINSFSPDDYKEMLQSLIANQFDDFFSLRMAYTKTEFYNPYDPSIREQLGRMRALMDSEQYTKALMVADSIFAVNFVDISAHLYCGYIYRQLKDEENSNLHYNIFDGLLLSIVMSGDGKSPETAFIVIDTDEEFHILEHFQMKYNEQSLLHEGLYDFDLIKTTGIKDKIDYDVYFNITLPYTELKKVREGMR